MAARSEPCPGCGGLFPDGKGPTHDYMLSSPGCWAAFGEVLAREYASPALMEVHRLSVDAYAVQHPGDGSRRAIQSVGLHLARLLVQLEDDLAPAELNQLMLRLGRSKAELPLLKATGFPTLTVADVVAACEPSAHAEAVRRWARAAADQWADHHAFVRDWTARTLERHPS